MIFFNHEKIYKLFKAATSRDGLGLNYRVIFIEDATRGVDLKDIESQKRRLVNNGALMANSKDVRLIFS